MALRHPPPGREALEACAAGIVARRV